MSRTYTVTHPDGFVSKRTTANRQYPYAVVGSPADAEVYASTLERRAQRAEQEAAYLAAALVEPKVNVTSRGFRSAGRGEDEGHNGEHTYHNFQATLVGKGTRDVYCWCDSTGKATTYVDREQVVVDALEYVVRIANERVTALRREAARNTAQAAQVRAEGSVRSVDKSASEYVVLRWTSKSSLGDAYLRSQEGTYYLAIGRTLTVVETTEVTK